MVKSRSHRTQHWIPKSYLAAWHDPNCPPRHTAYVNRISKDGTEIDQRAPANIFSENNLYTITTPEGHRDLTLEHGLSGLENAFTGIRQRSLQEMKQLPDLPYLKFLAFVAAMHVRTPAMRDHHARIWSEVKGKVERLQNLMTSAAPEDVDAAITPSLAPAGETDITLDEVGKLAAAPLQNLLIPFIQSELTGLVAMKCEIFCTDHVNGFITSDAPVSWFDPQAHKLPPLDRSPGLATPTIEIAFPISPQQCALIHHGDATSGIRYLDAPDNIVSEINSRIRFYSNEHFVSRLGYLEREWFDPGKEPEDTWERSHR